MELFMIQGYIPTQKKWLNTGTGWKTEQKQGTLFHNEKAAVGALETLAKVGIPEPTSVLIVSFNLSEIDKVIYSLHTTRYTPGRAR